MVHDAVQYLFMSKPFQVYLPDPDHERLNAWARKRGWSKSRAVRAAIRALTRPAGEDPLLAASGMIEGLPRDLSARVDHYLEESFVVQVDRAARRHRLRSRVR